MARPRQFDESDVIEKAMLTFWRYGFEATSIGQLEKSTGISRISIYNAFKDKAGLFLKCLERYSASSREYFASEDFTEGGLDSIEALFEAASQDRSPDAPEHFGCLMLNTILDLESVDPQVKSIIARTRIAMMEGFKSAMCQAIKADEMHETSLAEIQDRADFLVGALWGGRMTARLHSDATMAQGVARTVIAVIDSWRTSE